MENQKGTFKILGKSAKRQEMSAERLQIASGNCWDFLNPEMTWKLRINLVDVLSRAGIR